MQELEFSGKNRRSDLTRLQRIYDEVAAEAQGIQSGAQVKEPIHRIVMIHAERGLGKTRLAMELYRYLTTTNDPEKYWPDNYERMAERVAVMPKAESCQYEGSPQFLWWGLGVADGPNPGNTIYNGLEDLFPHLTTVEIAGRRANSGKGFRNEVIDLAADVGLSLIHI